MIRTLALLVLAAQAAFGLSWDTDGFLAKFEYTITGVGKTAFIELPQKNTTAVAKDWEERNKPSMPEGLSSLILMCPSDDSTLCLFFDDIIGNVAGIQIAFDKDAISYAMYDMTAQGYSNWTTTQNGTTKYFWTHAAFFVTPETLQKDAATLLASTNNSTVLQESTISLTGLGGALNSVSTNASDFTGTDSDYTKQACIPWMGNHYFNVSDTTTCSADTLSPWFLLEYKEQFVGFGHLFYGNLTVVNSSSISYFENPSATAVKLIVPNAPECLYTLAAEPGVVTLHIYFKKYPYLITCLF